MTDEDTLRDIKSRISLAQTKKARAQVELETAQERRQRALDALEADFGITTPEDIERVQKSLNSELDNALATVTSALDIVQ